MNTPRLITDSFCQYANHDPDKVAIVINAHPLASHSQTISRVSYGALYRKVQTIAHVVKSLALDPAIPPRIGLKLANSPEWIACFLGIAMGGGTAVVLDPKWTALQLQQVLQRMQLAKLIDEHTLAQFIDLPLFRLPYRPVYSISDSTPFYIGFTSGTTGYPKAFSRTHGSWVNSFIASAMEFGTCAADHILAPGPLVHGLTLYAAVEGLAVGATVYLLTRFDVQSALYYLQHSPITVLVGVPTLLRALTDGNSTVQYDQVRAVISAGAKLDNATRQSLVKLFPNATLFEYYGASELSFVSVANSRESVPFDSVGRAFYGVELSIRRENGTPASRGEIGWIGVRSAMVCSGYVDTTDATGFQIRNGWATVGDWGWQDNHGYLYLVGREKDMLISGGLNVYPMEIETLLKQLPEIIEVVVLGLKDHYWGDLVCAVIQFRESACLSKAFLQSHCRTYLERYKCPQRFFTVRHFPMTTSGKVARTQLHTLLLQQSTSDTDGIAITEIT